MLPNDNASFTFSNIAGGPHGHDTLHYYDLLTNIPIPAVDPTFYGYNFTRWIMRVSYVGPVNTGNGKAVDQTLEILYDNLTLNDNTTSFPTGLRKQSPATRSSASPSSTCGRLQPRPRP